MPHFNKACNDCHQHTSSFTAGKEHVATTVECQACHPNSIIESAVLPGTKGFNYSLNEAHWSLYNTALSNNLLKGANEACAACHTNYDISITFSRPDFYQFYIDYGTSTLDGGALNGTPDRLVVEGKADVTNFVNADDIFWRDVNTDSDWDPDEDIFFDTDTSGTYNSGDTILYVGSNGQDAFGAAVEFFGNEGEIFYLDSDHDNVYDYSSGTEEPLVYVGSEGGSVTTGGNLLSNHEILKPFGSISWITDAFKFVNTNYYFLDNGTGTPATFDSDEVIILDDGNRIIEYGILNGVSSPDSVVTSGFCNLSVFDSLDKVRFYDKNINGNWDADEDIVFDDDDDGLFDYFGSIFDTTLYVGGSFELTNGDSLEDLDPSSSLRYIDSNHSGEYDLGEPIVISNDLILDSADELLLREDDIYNNGTKTFGMWVFDLNPFTAEFFIDDNGNNQYDDGEAIIRETYRIYSDSFSGVETSSGEITYSTDSSGLHRYRNGTAIWNATGRSVCGDTGSGCHQDIKNAITDGYGGGHYTNSTLGGHSESSYCGTCHRESTQIDPDNDHFDAITGAWHAAKRISCAYKGSGCHENLFPGGLMEEIFLEIQKLNFSTQGDICWSCHRGDFDWTDPTGKQFRVYVEDEAAYQQVMIDSAWVYSPTYYNNCDCHNGSLGFVPVVPWGSGKYVDHLTSSGGNYNSCQKCHQENIDPHNDSHSISMDWSTWETDYGGIPSSFCDTTCHYSVNDARPIYIDTNTTWMAQEYDNWFRNGGRHTYTTVLGGDGSTVGSVNCTSCHTTHSTVPSCAGGGCHLDDSAVTNKRDVPSSHAAVAGTIDTDRLPCARSNCHIGGGHDPKPPGCHISGNTCNPGTNAHPKHNLSASSYRFTCTECHYDSASGYNNGQGTYGGVMHFNGTVNVIFSTLAVSNATFGGALSGGNLPTYNSTYKTCSGTYCHSNGYDISSGGPGAGFKSFDTPAWNGTGVNCGDCHGVPNYYNGTAWRELGGPVTGESASHLKHVRNYNMSGLAGYDTRFLAYIDNDGDGVVDTNEVIISDNDGNYYLNGGKLDGTGSPDEVITAGKADITLFDSTNDPDVYWYDADGGNDYDYGEDISFNLDGDGTLWETPERVYDGSGGQTGGNGWLLIGSYANAYNYVAFLDVDHDGTYDGAFGGFKEALIIKSSAYPVPTLQTITVDEDLTSNHWVLVNMSYYASGSESEVEGAPWWSAYFNWNNYTCSECHYNNPPTPGFGTYNTSLHVDMSKDVYPITPSINEISDQFGWASTNPTFVASNKTCSGTWCHSNNIDSTTDAVWGVGTGTNWAMAEWPDWDNPAIVCGDCHKATVNMEMGTIGVDHQNSYPHDQGQHYVAVDDYRDSNNDDDYYDAVGPVNCRWCHNLNDRPDFESYGTGLHADGYYSGSTSNTNVRLHEFANKGKLPDKECHKNEFQH